MLSGGGGAVVDVVAGIGASLVPRVVVESGATSDAGSDEATGVLVLWKGRAPTIEGAAPVCTAVGAAPVCTVVGAVGVLVVDAAGEVTDLVLAAAALLPGGSTRIGTGGEVGRDDLGTVEVVPWAAETGAANLGAVEVVVPWAIEALVPWTGLGAGCTTCVGLPACLASRPIGLGIRAEFCSFSAVGLSPFSRINAGSLGTGGTGSPLGAPRPLALVGVVACDDAPLLGVLSRSTELVDALPARFLEERFQRNALKGPPPLDLEPAFCLLLRDDELGMRRRRRRSSECERACPVAAVLTEAVSSALPWIGAPSFPTSALVLLFFRAGKPGRCKSDVSGAAPFSLLRSPFAAVPAAAGLAVLAFEESVDAASWAPPWGFLAKSSVLLATDWPAFLFLARFRSENRGMLSRFVSRLGKP